MKLISVNKSKIKKPIHIEDIKVGQIENFKIKITKKIHNDFKNFSKDKSPIHTNKEFCKKNGYKNVVGHAFLLTTILSNIYGMYFPGGNELCVRQTCNFRQPFFIGDTLRYKVKVISVNKLNKIIILNIEIKNNSNFMIFDGESILKLSLKGDGQKK